MWVKPELTRQVTDPALIAQLAAEAKDSDVRVVAIGKLSDQAVLAKLVAKTEDWDVRRAAVARLAEVYAPVFAAASGGCRGRW